MIYFQQLTPTHYDLGFLPGFLSENDPRSAREQLNENYAHGGGWDPLSGFELDPATLVLSYKGDPPYKPLAKAHLRDELLVFYPYEWLAIIQPDGSFEVSRMD